ncbi:MAG: apolipoprotein N-acyltransferase [Pirellulales bacterium]|nr:apolipoprotein N-acyltransferase [Pirellulales bacterium]
MTTFAACAPPVAGHPRVGVLAESIATLALAISSGVLVAVSVFHSWVAWCAIVPLAIALRHSRLRAELAMGLFVGGLLAHLGALDWMRTARAFHEVFGPRALEWLCLGLLGALYWTCSLSVAAWLLRSVSLPLAAALPVVWVSHEYLWKTGFALLDETGFPWLQLGSTQVDRLWLAQLADVAGVWGVTAAVVSVNGALADLLVGALADAPLRRRALAGTLIALLVVAAAGVYGARRLHVAEQQPGPVVALMPAERPASRANLSPLRLAATSADVLLWSECAHGDLDAPQAGPSSSEVGELARTLGATLLVTASRDEGDVRRRSMMAYTADFERQIYDKQKLVPWNEFTPWLRIRGITKRGSNFAAGKTWPVFQFRDARRRSWRAAGLICYDVCFPEVTRGYMQGGARPHFFVVSADEDADATMSLQRQILNLARFRAIETRRAVVRNAYHGYSGIIDSCGRVYRSADATVLREPWIGPPVPIDGRETLYARRGDWLPQGLIGVVLLVALSRMPVGSRVRAWALRLNGLVERWRRQGDEVGGKAAARVSWRARRDGFTIVELLVVMAIIGVLLALTGVAVQRARETARRVTCQQNLHQIGIALHSYHAGIGSLPPALVWHPAGEPLGGGELPIGVVDRVARYGRPEQDRIYANWVVALLPGLEQPALYTRFDARVPIAHERNAAVRMARLPVMLCPSDSYNSEANLYERGGAAGLHDNRYSRGNYAINVGPDAGCIAPGTVEQPCKGGFFVDSLDLARRNSQVWGSGIAGANKSMKFADITDGLANTVAIDEIRAGLSPIDPRGVWALGQVGASVIVRHGQYSNTGGPNACDYDTDRFIGCSTLKQLLGAASLRRDCMDCEPFSLETEVNVKSTARSLHDGGVMVLLCDGAVRFVANGIDLATWHALHTRNKKDQAELTQ